MDKDTDVDELTSTASSETDESTPLLASRRDSGASVIVTKKKASFSLVRPILKQWLPMLIAVSCYIFSRGHSPFFFSFLLIFGGLGVRVFWVGRLDWVFGVWISVDGFRTCGVGPSGILGAGALSINIKE